MIRPINAVRAGERGGDARRQAGPPIDRREVLGTDHEWQIGQFRHLGHGRRPDAGHRIGEQPGEGIERDHGTELGEHSDPQLTFADVTATDRRDALEYAHRRRRYATGGPKKLGW